MIVHVRFRKSVNFYGGFMKKLLIIAFAGLIGASSFSYDIVSATQLKTKAKTVTQTDFSIASKFGEYFRTPSRKIVNSYDSLGRVTESSEFTPRDVLVNKITSSYDSMGNLSARACFDSDNKKIWNTAITYKDGLKSEESEYTENGTLKAKTIYTYTDKILTDESYYNAEGGLIWKIIYKYNATKKLDVEYEYSGDGMLDDERRYSYNDAGLIDSISYHDETGSVKLKDVFRYSSDKTLNEVTTYNSENKIIKRSVVKNDTSGNISRITVYNVAKKFGTTVNEMADMTEFVYDYAR